MTPTVRLFALMILGTSLVHAGVGGGPFVSGTLRQSSESESITGITRLNDGTFAVCGWTDATEPWDGVTGGVQSEHGGSRDAFVAVLSNDLKTVRAFTFFGGLQNDSATAITVDGNGTIVVVGTTESATLPVKTGAFSPLYSNYIDGFVFGFSPDLKTVRFGSYINGSKNDIPLDVEVDELNTIYICGKTSSPYGFPTTNAVDRTHEGGYDGFLMRLSEHAGSMLYSTYYGGGGDDVFNDLAVHPSGNVAVAATTYSASFPTYPSVNPQWWWLNTDRPYDWSYNGGNSDAALVILSRDGARVIVATLYGGDGDDEGNAVILNADDVTLIGTTTSTDLPSTGGMQVELSGGSDVMMVKLNATGRTLLGASYFGGSGNEVVKGAASHANGPYAIWGTSTSSDLPKHAVGSRTDPAGGRDVFLCTTGLGSVSMTTLFGGSSDDVSMDAAVEPDGGLVFVGASTSSTLLLDGPTLVNNGETDAMVVRYQRGEVDLLSPVGRDAICIGQSVVVSWSTTEMLPSDTYVVEFSTDEEEWTIVGGPVSGKQYNWSPPSSMQGTSGWLRVRSLRYHASATERSIRIDPQIKITRSPASSVQVCPDGNKTLRVVASAPNVRYQWRRNAAPINGATADTLMLRGDAANVAGQYDVIVTAECGQSITSSQSIVTVGPLTMIREYPRDTVIKQGGTLVLKVVATGTDLKYAWTFQNAPLPAQTSATLTIANVTSSNAGIYECTVTGECGIRQTAKVTVTVTGITSVTEDRPTTLGIYPNPTPGHCTLTTSRPSTLIEVFDLLGVRVHVAGNESGAETVSLDLTQLPTGTYVVRWGEMAGMLIRE